MKDQLRRRKILYFPKQFHFFRKFFIGTVMAVLLSFGHHAVAGWEVNWIDSFDGMGVDWSNWTAQTEADFNGEIQCYTDDDSSAEKNYDVSNGTLKIIARRQANAVVCNTFRGAQQKMWTSGRINTKDKKEFLYGRIEARIKFHNLEGGTWPAFWMLENRIKEQPIAGDGDNVAWPNPGAGEVDIWEWYANNSGSYITNFFNASSSGCGSRVIHNYPGGAADVQQWHDYALEWQPDYMKFYVNDTLVASHNISTCPQYKEPMFILLNVAMGGTLGGSIDANLSEATMEVDYVSHCSATTSNNASRCNESTPLAASTSTTNSNASSSNTNSGDSGNSGSGGGGYIQIVFLLLVGGLVMLRRRFFV